MLTAADLTKNTLGLEIGVRIDGIEWFGRVEQLTTSPIGVSVKLDGQTFVLPRGKLLHLSDTELRNWALVEDDAEVRGRLLAAVLAGSAS